MELIRAFKNLSKNDAGLAGGKGASLGEMTQVGIPVPPGFVVLSASFEQFIKETDLIQEIDSILSKVNHREIHTVESASEKIRELILNAEMPKDISTEIDLSFKELNTKYVAVRSSATAEDGKDHAWAGQLESYLNTTEDDILNKVKLCWSSLFTPRAIFYRFEKGLDTTKISVAVVVQKMVVSEVSGIAFSVHPVTEDPNQLIIEAGFGLGEAIVSGSVTPDSYVVEKQPRNILDINVSTQNRGLYRSDMASLEHGNNQWINIPEPKASSQVLTKNQILELSEIIIGIENHYEFPCDIEWAFEDEKFYIVQSRPITTLSNKVKDISVNKISDIPEDLLVMRDRPASLTPTYWNQVLETGYKVKDIYGITLNLGYMIFNKGRMVYVLDKKDWNSVGEFVSDKIINEVGYFDKIKKESINAKAEIQKFFTEAESLNAGNLGLDKLTQLAIKIRDLFDLYDAASVLAWFIAGDSLKQKIGNILSLSKDDLDIISTPVEKTFASQMEKAILEISLSDSKNIEEEAVNLSKRFYWIPFNYDGPTIWDTSYFIDQINEARKNIEESKVKLENIKLGDIAHDEKQASILKNSDFASDKLYLIDTLRTVTEWTDERKMLDFQLFYHYNVVLSAISNIVGIPTGNLKYLFTHELASLETNLGSVKKDMDFRINNEFVVLAKDGVLKILPEEEMQTFKRKVTESQSHDGEIKGNVACAGPDKIYRAKVKILMSSEECSKIEEGEFLVTTMTTPDYVPAMKKALGFITDEGGVTCHAAIIAREMKKPCVIGTKNATKVLKDGDMVEVDTEKGVVKIIK